MDTEAQNFSMARYQHHHSKWVEAQSHGDHRLARMHLYALRAHLHNLGWLAPQHRIPGLGVRKVSV